MKITLGLLALLFLVLPTAVQARSGPGEDLLKNYFYLQLPGGDRGTVYIDNESELVFLPDQINKDYVHICRAQWSYKEALGIFSIKKARSCRLLNGDYKLSHSDHQLILSGDHRYVLKTLLRR